jgi:hypothetical protein
MNHEVRSALSRVVLPIALGVVAALGTSWFVGKAGRAEASGGEARAPRAADPTQFPVRMGRTGGATGSLEARVAHLEMSEHESDRDEMSAESLQLAREREDVDTLRSYNEDLERHRSSPRQANWADGAEKMIEADLAAMEQQAAFQLQEVDCRSDSCVGVVKWSSYEDALANWDALLRGYSVMCATKIYLSEPQDKQAPYAAQLLLHHCQAD